MQSNHSAYGIHGIYYCSIICVIQFVSQSPLTSYSYCWPPPSLHFVHRYYSIQHASFPNTQLHSFTAHVHAHTHTHTHTHTLTTQSETHSYTVIQLTHTYTYSNSPHTHIVQPSRFGGNCFTSQTNLDRDVVCSTFKKNVIVSGNESRSCILSSRSSFPSRFFCHFQG